MRNIELFSQRPGCLTYIERIEQILYLASEKPIGEERRCTIQRRWLEVSVEENLKLVATLAKAVDSKDWSRVRDCFVKGAILKIPGTLGVAVSLEDMIEGWRSEAATFPDARREIIGGFGQDDLICVEVQETGTHKGSLVHAGKTYSPTGKRFKVVVCLVFRIRENKISEMRLFCDPQEHLAQLGIL